VENNLMMFLCEALSCITLIGVAYIETNNRKQRKKSEERAALRERESRLGMELMVSTSQLSDVISIAVTGGHTNGNVEEAQTRARKAREAYDDFLRDIASHDVAKI
jgi:hypothetical protein